MTYIDVNELAVRLSYNPRYITNRLRPERLTEGRHFVRPFGGRKVLYIWEAIEEVIPPKNNRGDKWNFLP